MSISDLSNVDLLLHKPSNKEEINKALRDMLNACQLLNKLNLSIRSVLFEDFDSKSMYCADVLVNGNKITINQVNEKEIEVWKS